MSQLVEWAMFLLNTCLITFTIVVLALLLAAFCRRQVVWKHHVLSCGLVLIAITLLLAWRFPVSYYRFWLATFVGVWGWG